MMNRKHSTLLSLPLLLLGQTLCALPTHARR